MSHSRIYIISKTKTSYDHDKVEHLLDEQSFIDYWDRDTNKIDDMKWFKAAYDEILTFTDNKFKPNLKKIESYLNNILTKLKNLVSNITLDEFANLYDPTMYDILRYVEPMFGFYVVAIGDYYPEIMPMEDFIKLMYFSKDKSTYTVLDSYDYHF